jgi:hypothetical protein
MDHVSELGVHKFHEVVNDKASWFGFHEATGVENPRVPLSVMLLHRSAVTHQTL